MLRSVKTKMLNKMYRIIVRKLFETGTVLSQEYEGEGIRMTVRVSAGEIGRWEKYFVKK